MCATPATVVNDAPEGFDLWRPKNFETGEYLGPVRLREALAKSINTVSIRITYDIKPETVVGIERFLGSGLIPGIGPELARRLVDKFGKETLEVIDHQPGRLVEDTMNNATPAWSPRARSRRCASFDPESS